MPFELLDNRIVFCIYYFDEQFAVVEGLGQVNGMTRHDALGCDSYLLSLRIDGNGPYPDAICISNKAMQLTLVFHVSPDKIVAR